MVKVRLVDVFVEHQKKDIREKEFGKEGKRWWALVALQLYDEISEQQVAEWFYLFVCSKRCLEKPFKKMPAMANKYLVVQEKFNIENIKKIAKEKLSKVSAKDWDEFYVQMEKEFLHED